MIRKSVNAEAAMVFEKLKYAKEYRNGFASAKLGIIKRLLAHKYELRTFAQTPSRRPYQVNGFFMEYCARFSNQLPKNTSKAQYISEAIIDYLKTYRMCNPDHLWLKIQGKRIMLTGMGEVKSHMASITHNPGQLFLQETNIRNFIDHGDIASIVSNRYRVTLADQFMRRLILPRSLNVPYALPTSVPLGWEVKEIEFTFLEIIFLKNLLLADAPDVKSPELIYPYSPEDYHMFTRNITKRVEKIIMEFLRNLFPVDQKDVRDALTMWSLVWNSIPTNHESVALIIQWMNAIKQTNTCAFSLLTTPPLSLAQLNGEEYASRDSLLRYTDDHNTILIHALLSRLQEIRQKLPDPPKLSKKQEVNLFALL